MEASLRSVSCALAALTLFGLSACTDGDWAAADRRNQVIVSVRDQRLTVVKSDQTRETFAISTSKFGLGDRPRSFATPLGKMEIAGKIGAGAQPGTVFKGRLRTGEIVEVNSPGRDPIVTRILRLRGLEAQNSRAASRGIYIHGTPEEARIGEPVSYGCIRMKSDDVIRLYNLVAVGSKVTILDEPLSAAVARAVPAAPRPAATAAPEGPATPAQPSSVVLTQSTTAAKDGQWAGDPAKLLAGGGTTVLRSHSPRRKVARTARHDDTM